MRKFNCPDCGKHSSDVDESRELCTRCWTTFLSARRAGTPIEPPRTVDVRQAPGVLVLEWRPLRNPWHLAASIAVLLVWLTLTGLFIYGFLQDGVTVPGVIAFVGFCGLLGWITASCWLDRTVLRVSATSIERADGWITWPRQPREQVSMADFRDLASVEVSTPGTGTSGSTISYALRVYSLSGTRVDLASGLQPEEAAFLEQEVMRFIHALD